MTGGVFGESFLQGALGRLGATPKYSKTEAEMVEIATRLATERMTTLLHIAATAAGSVGVAVSYPDLLAVTCRVFEEQLGRTRIEHHIPSEDDDAGYHPFMRKPRDIRPEPMPHVCIHGDVAGECSVRRCEHERDPR